MKTKELKEKQKNLKFYFRLIENSPRYHRASAPDKTIIVIGIPNVGKSTVINQLRKLDI